MELEVVVLLSQVGVTLVGLMVTAFIGMESILILFPKKRTEKKLFFKKKCKSKDCSVYLLSRSEFCNYKISFLFICLLDFPPTKYI